MRPEHWLYTIPLRLRSLFRWAQADQELDDELRDHLERKTEEYVAQGMTQEEAHRRARLDLDGIEQTKEKCRDARRLNWIHDLIQDLHYGVRMLRKSPGFTTIAVLTLALGIGANTAIFSLIHAVMLRMLPVPQAEQLVLLSWVAPGHPYMIHSLSGNFDRDKTGNFTSTSFSYPIFQAIHDRNLAFSGVLAFAEADTDRLNVSVGGLSELAQGQLVSGDSFSTLGIHAAIGRTILPSDDKEGASPVAVASYSYWVRRFGRDPLAVGKEITVNGVPFIAHNLGDAEGEFLQAIADALKSRFKGVVVLGGCANHAVALVASVSPEFTAKVQAGKIIQAIAPVVGGKGGGRPDLARGGGKDAAKLEEALAKAKSLLG